MRENAAFDRLIGTLGAISFDFKKEMLNVHFEQNSLKNNPNLLPRLERWQIWGF